MGSLVGIEGSRALWLLGLVGACRVSSKVSEMLIFSVEKFCERPRNSCAQKTMKLGFRA